MLDKSSITETHVVEFRGTLQLTIRRVAPAGDAFLCGACGTAFDPATSRARRFATFCSTQCEEGRS